MTERGGYWAAPLLSERPVLRGRHTADAVVVGGGVSGVTIALWLCRAGLRVTLLEAGALGGGMEKCAGVVSVSRRLQYAALERAFGLAAIDAYACTQNQALHSLRELLHTAGEKVEWQDTALRLTVADAKLLPLLESEQNAMRRAGLSAEVTRSLQSPLPAVAALEMNGMATLNPMEYLRFLLFQAQKAGVKVYEHSRVTAMETNLAMTERGSVQAPYLIIATGYPIVNIPGWYFLRMEQRRARLVSLAGGGGFEGVYVDANGAYVLRRRQETTLLEETGGRIGAPARWSRDTARLWEDAAAGRRIMQRQEGVIAFTPDGLPYIGPYSAQTPNLFVAAGYGGNGLLMSVVAAQAISARVLGLPYDAYEVYSGQRRKGAAAMAARTLGRYLGGYLWRPSAPRCSHLGCKLVYNQHSRLWECPCHGSRFDDIGHVLGAPAVQPARLKRKK